VKCDHGVELTLRCEECEAGAIAGEHRGFARTPPSSDERTLPEPRARYWLLLTQLLRGGVGGEP